MKKLVNNINIVAYSLYMLNIVFIIIVIISVTINSIYMFLQSLYTICLVEFEMMTVIGRIVKTSSGIYVDLTGIVPEGQLLFVNYIFPAFAYVYNEVCDSIERGLEYMIINNHNYILSFIDDFYFVMVIMSYFTIPYFIYNFLKELWSDLGFLFRANK